MNCHAKSTDPIKIEADLLAVFVRPSPKEGSAPVLTDEAKKIDGALGGLVTDVVEAETFDPKIGKTLLVHSHGKIRSRRVLLVGLGASEKLTVSNLHVTAATIGKEGKRVSAKRLAIAVPRELFDGFTVSLVGQSLTEGLLLGAYAFNRHKSKGSKTEDKQIDEVCFVTSADKLDAFTGGIRMGETVARAVSFARDLVNEPPSVTTPTHLAAVARNLTKGRAGMSCKILNRGEMQKLGMGGILGIAQGSDEEPKFIRLDYAGGSKKTVCLVGKGITFDSGGLSLKPSSGMETMKIDMAGAASILGVFSVLPILKPNVTVVGLISATENMPSGRAIKPGDVVTAMNGKTIEVLNTDAEGRVVLADALSYAVEKVQPDVIIDLATLTGACMVALGEEVAGLFANDERLAEILKAKAKDAGERVWELPLVKEYNELLKSSVADIKNISGKKYGGAITGALFLQEFVPDTVSWAHIDIAGPAYAEKDAPLTPVGGTGFGVRMLLAYLLSL